MLSHPAGDVELFEPDHPDLPAAAEVVLAWARSYLCRPHPDLGRGGDVCPYTAVSLERGGLFLAVHPGRPDLRAVMTAYRDWFPDLPPCEGPGPGTGRSWWCCRTSRPGRSTARSGS